MSNKTSVSAEWETGKKGKVCEMASHQGLGPQRQGNSNSSNRNMRCSLAGTATVCSLASTLFLDKQEEVWVCRRYLR
jgi:hypothetical protein